MISTRTGHVSRAIAIAALLALTALAGLVLALQASNEARFDETESALERAQQEISELGRELAAAQSEQQTAAGRMTALETEIRGQPDIPQTAKSASKSVFTIETDDGSGSGFVVASRPGRALLITNFHVVARTYVNGKRDVVVRRGPLTYDGMVVDASESNDLAVIRVQERLPALKLTIQRQAIGEPVLVLGSPLGLGGTVTSGIISAYRTEDGLNYMQFSAPISPGNSGGPVINSQGQVIGVAVAKLVGEGAEGLGFAIPTSRLCAALDVC